MPRFSANLTFLFKEYPFLERFEAAKDAGFEGVEVLFPYDDAASELLRRLKRADLPLVLINTPPPNWTGGDRGFAAVPGLEARFKSDFRRTLRFAQRLGPHHIHVMAGKADGPDAKATFIDNLKWAATEAPQQSLTIEPINADDMPGYYLNDFGKAADIIAAVDAPNVGLQFDAYHAQKITGDVMGTFDQVSSITRHIQVASVPGRNEPDAVTIDYPAFFAQLDDIGYSGFVSGEYNPIGRTSEGLGWLKMKAKK